MAESGMGHDARTRAAFHESGHAVASVRRGGYVKYIDLSKVEEQEQETCTDDCRANVPFMIWAGPWAQARWEGDCTTDRIKTIFQTQSFWDWPLYEERFGRDDVRAWADAANAAKEIDRPMPGNPPPVTSPEPCWHRELQQAWPEIERLAESLLKGESPIELGNGQQLIRDGWRDYWSDPNAPSVEDDES
jgi:hypothetical protein